MSQQQQIGESEEGCDGSAKKSNPKITTSNIQRVLREEFKPDYFERMRCFKQMREASGRLELETGQPERRYLCIKCEGSAEKCKPTIDASMIREFLLKEWKLKQPQVLLSITGSDGNFELDAKDTEEVMMGLVQTAKSINAWFLTAGIHAGVAKYMGKARKLYAEDITMIGIVGSGCVRGSSFFKQSQQCGDGKMPSTYKEVCRSQTENANAVMLDPNHTHFILADNDKAGEFSTEVVLRQELERAIQEGETLSLPQNGGDKTAHKGDEAEHSGDKTEHRGEETAQGQPPPPMQRAATDAELASQQRSHVQEGMASGRSFSRTTINVQGKARNEAGSETTPSAARSWIPCVCVSVNGSAGALLKLCAAAEAGIACLLVEGSGKATDFLCEALAAHDRWRNGDRGGALASLLPPSPPSTPAARGTAQPAARQAVTEREERERILIKIFKTFRSNAPAEDGGEGEAQAVTSTYDFDKVEQRDIRALFHDGHGIRFAGYGQQAARSTLKRVLTSVFEFRARFSVYRLGRDKAWQQDLTSALLQCILRCEDEKREDDPLWLQNKILMAVKWDRPFILREILRASRGGKNLQRYLTALEVGALEALCRGSHESVQALVEHGADLKGFGVTRTYLRQQRKDLMQVIARTPSNEGQGPMKRKDLIQMCREAVVWEVLLTQSIKHRQAQHVRIMIKEVRATIWQQELNTSLKGKDGEWMSIKTLEEQSDEIREDRTLMQPEALLFNMLWLDEEHIANGIKRLMSDKQLTDCFYRSVHWFLRMDHIYYSLIGQEFRFSSGILGKNWDLFLCMVLMSHHKVAVLVWQKIDRPIHAALVACLLNKRMATRPYVRKEVAQDMLENAAQWERFATEEMMEMMDESMEDAWELLETRSRLLRGHTLFDLAVSAQADSFLVSCCKEVNIQRFFGDIEPDHDFLHLPSWVWVVICIPTLGLLAPLVLDYRLPPESEFTRSPSQRRRIPPFYPEEPAENPTVKAEMTAMIKDANAKDAKDIEWKYEKDRYKELAVSTRKRMWARTFSYGERWKCFVVAPVTAHNLSAMLYFAVVVLYTDIITGGHLCFDAARWSEWAVLLYMLGFLALQLSELAWSGANQFHFGGRNFSELLIVVLFFAGCLGRCWDALVPLLQTFAVQLGLEAEGTVTVCVPERPTAFAKAAVGLAEQWAYFVGDDVGEEGGPGAAAAASACSGRVQLSLTWHCNRLCNFLCWIRILRLYSIDETLGTLVRSLWLSWWDITILVSLWAVFVVAFASALNGGLPPQTRAPSDSGETEIKSRYWWIMQTYLRAFGEGEEVDQEDDYITVAIAMTILLVLQLILKDTVFTAVLTNKLRDTQKGGELQWMADMYHTTNHFLEYNFPVPLNLLQCLFWNRILSHLNKEKAESIIHDEQDSGLPVTPKWAVLRHLRNSRFAGMHTLPREIEEELQDERKNLKKGAPSAKSEGQEGGALEDAEAKEAARQVWRERDSRQRHRALTIRAKARFAAKTREEEQRKNQFKTEEAAYLALQDQLDGLAQETRLKLDKLLQGGGGLHSKEQPEGQTEEQADTSNSSSQPATPDQNAESKSSSSMSIPASNNAGLQEHKLAAILEFGKATDATKGLRALLGLKNDKTFGDKLSQGMRALEEEWHGTGSQEDIANYEYVVNGRARNEEHVPLHVREQFKKGKYHGGDLDEADFDMGHDDMVLADFAQHPHALIADLSLQEVASLRLYTTSSFAAINTPLRKRETPHPKAITVFHLAEGLKKLRTVLANSNASDFNQHMTLWRGIKDRIVDMKKFFEQGGTELAPMSSTPNLGVAQSYAESEVPLLLEYDTTGMTRGCSISFLSVFPKEEEYLYPPLTFLQPIEQRQLQTNSSITVLKVAPVYA